MQMLSESSFIFIFNFFLVSILQAEGPDAGRPNRQASSPGHSVVFGRGFGRYMFLLLPCELYKE